MFKDKIIDTMSYMMNDDGLPVGLIILFKDGTEVVIDDNLDLYSKDKESEHFGWIHPNNIINK